MKARYFRSYDTKRFEERGNVDFEQIKRLLRYLNPYRAVLAFAVASLFLAKGLEAYVPFYLGKLTQQAIDASGAGAEGKELIYRQLVDGAFLMLAILIGSYFFEGINVLLKSWAGQKALNAFRCDIYSKIQLLPLRYYDTHSVGSLMTRTIHDVEQVNQMFAESIVPIVGNIMLFICIFIGITFIDWRLALATACLLPLVLWHTDHFRRSQRKSFTRVRAIVSALNGYIQEHLMGAAVIRSFGLEEREFHPFEEMNQDQKQAHLETVHNFSFFIAGIDFAIALFLVVIFVLMVYHAPIGGFQPGAFFTMSLYALMIFRPLSDLAERYNVLQSAVAAAERIFDVIDEPPEEEEVLKEAPPLEEIEEISFDDVWFAYSGEEWVIRGATFTVRKGESLAIVGETGAGKSTLCALLLRFYDGYRGEIRINGRDIRSWPRWQLRRHFSAVLQDPVLFSGTIAQNIALMDPAMGRGEIEEAAAYVGLTPFLERMGNGLDQQLAERGQGLSVGEGQLIAMARAVAYKRDLLILDEATANIDTFSERVIQKALLRLLRGRTALVIAHRLSTIRDSSRIIVMHEGTIVEEGSHHELLALGGIYEKMCRLQEFSS